MHAMTGWFIRNPVAANLMMALILFLGVMAVFTIRIEGFPRIPPDSIQITTEYNGATAEQVDELVTRKIELRCCRFCGRQLKLSSLSPRIA